MASTEERLKILKMVQDGKIKAEEAAELLKALDSADRSEQPKPRPTGAYDPGAGRYFRVRVTDTDSGRTRVNIRMPLTIVNAGLRMGMKFAPQVEGLDPKELSRIIETGGMGKIVDIIDDDDGEHVEVFIE